eukprot:246163-Rhodomonas_salina.5
MKQTAASDAESQLEPRGAARLHPPKKLVFPATTTWIRMENRTTQAPTPEHIAAGGASASRPP